LTRAEFGEGIYRLESYLQKELDEANVEIYWKEYEKYNAVIFLRAIDNLIRTHSFRTFPLIPEIDQAIEEAIAEAGRRDYSDIPECDKCHGEGRDIVPDGAAGREIFCDCAMGKKRIEARKDYIKKHGRGYWKKPPPLLAAEPWPEDDPGDIPF